MFRQMRLISMATLSIIAFAGPAGVVMDNPGYATAISSIVEFVQITTMQLESGEQTFEAFRILRNGQVEWARWNSSGYLLDHAEPFDMGSETFNRVVSSQSFLNPPKPRQNEGTVGRPAFRIDIATFSGSGINAVSITKIPVDIIALTDELRRKVKAIPVKSGWYIWTQPYLQIGRTDIDLTEVDCDSPIAMVLSKSVATGRLIMRAEDGIQSFISGEQAYRIAFEAKLERGNLRFGILFAK